MILDGKKLSEEILERLKNDVAELKKFGVVPGLGIVLIGENPASQLYISMKQRAAEELGMKCELVILPENASEVEAIRAIERMNRDSTLHGIIVQLPVPKTLVQERVCSAIALQKDIDCLNPATLKKLEEGDTAIRPPTAEAVLRLIKESGYDIAGRRAVVIGSGFFGSQIAHHLKNTGADVEQVPFRSDQLVQYSRVADILVSATGRGHSVGSDHVKEGAAVIDVGVSRVGDEVIGDVDFDRVKDKAAAITPVPGGVGPVTVACLLENVVMAVKKL